jgi:transposase
LAVLVDALLPDTAHVRLEHVLVDSNQLILAVGATRAEVACPLCHQPARRVQSKYTRTLADLPWASTRVQLQLHVRRFFCPNPTCIRKIFTERLPDLVVPYARRTNRLRDQLLEAGFALGGEAGARHCARQGMPISPDTLLALLRRSFPPAHPTPPVLGVDDWSFRRGKSMATILVDLEQHRPIDLLPESTEQAFSAWLEAHPGVEIISRDRGEAYAGGGTVGAPDAIHVADRWHLLKNLSDSVQKLMARHTAALRQAAQTAKAGADPAVLPPATLPAPPPKRRARKPKPATVSFQRTRQLAMYEQVRALSKQGWSVAALARHLKLTKMTVRKYRDMEKFLLSTHHGTSVRGRTLPRAPRAALGDHQHRSETTLAGAAGAGLSRELQERLDVHALLAAADGAGCTCSTSGTISTCPNTASGDVAAHTASRLPQ